MAGNTIPIPNTIKRKEEKKKKENNFHQLPSSKVPLYVELLAGKMLYRAPIAEDLLYSTAPSLQWHAHSFVVLVILFYCEFAAPYLEHIKEQICTQFKLSVNAFGSSADTRTFRIPKRKKKFQGQRSVFRLVPVTTPLTCTLYAMPETKSQVKTQKHNVHFTLDPLPLSIPPPPPPPPVPTPDLHPQQQQKSNACRK